MELLYKEVTDKILKCIYNVYNELGSGFLESVYEKSLLIEIRKMGMKVENQGQLKVIIKKIL